MYSRFSFIVFIVFTATINGFGFEVISTTQIPQEHSSSDTSLSCSALKENNYRMLSLELQNIKFQKYLEDQSKLDEVECSTNLQKTDELLQKVKQINLKTEQKLEKKIEALVRSLETKLEKIEENIISKLNLSQSQEHQNRSCESVPSCKIISRENGWTYVLKRFNGSQDFNLTWNDYRNGFGSAEGELWLGLECLYQLTNCQNYELMVNLVSANDQKKYASYKKIQIGPEQDGYRLKVLDNYFGSAGDGLSPLFGMKFTTKDKQNDNNGAANCGLHFGGGWWFNRCYVMASLLTGTYKSHFAWFPSNFDVIKEAQMKIKPRNS